jgi:hypothetical protein
MTFERMRMRFLVHTKFSIAAEVGQLAGALVLQAAIA